MCNNTGMIIGIDEAGRGAWAGPLVAAAVALKKPIAGLADSKKLSSKQRLVLAEEIRLHAHVGIGSVDAQTVDEVGLTKATSIAMEDALSLITEPYSEVIIDGIFNYLPGTPNVVTLVKADSKIAEVSAASIIAKVYRDQIMHEQSTIYPEYGFSKHVGYGTALHHQMIRQYGATPIHRMSYKPLQAILRVSDV